MAENSKIEWTENTFNIVEGCEKVSPGCKNCYAETRDKHWHGGEHWGPNSNRKPMSEAYWRKPAIWNVQAYKENRKIKVFCSSLCDVFEDHPDLVEPRERLFKIIESTSNLIWQLLTKRPENILKFVPPHWLDGFPENVWMGTTVENQEYAEIRLPLLYKVPAKVRFLSCEPLLGPVYLRFSVNDHLRGPAVVEAIDFISWVICGGESGHNARPIHPDWARLLRNQCDWANVPFFFKQWGEYLPDCQAGDKTNLDNTDHLFPSPHNPEKQNKYWKIGKKEAGGLLDGKEWKEFPV